jgi:hypothetical protein
MNLSKFFPGGVVATTAGLSVGQAAACVGVAPSTLRTWERRYAVTAGGRSSGGHRRYSLDDVALLRRMHDFVVAGEPPGRAALLARRSGDGADGGPGEDRPDGRDAVSGGAAPAGARGGPGGRVLAVPGAGPRVRGLARAALSLDVDAAARLVEQALVADGVVRAWDELVRPVLVAAGLHWARTGSGVEIEHLLTEATVEALRAHRRRLPQPDPDRPPAVLACAPHDEHTLPLYVLSVALREVGTPTRMLGARVPPAALAATVRRSGAAGVFVWSQLPDRRSVETLRLPATRPPVRVVVGGPGWAGADLPGGCELVADLAGAVGVLAYPAS